MDIHKAGWHSRLTITGNSQEFRFEGSWLAIMKQVSESLINLNPRVLADGNKGFSLEVSTSPITSARVEELRKEQEVAALLEVSESDLCQWKPLDGEDMAAMTLRLVRTVPMHYPEADFWARDAFGYPPDPNMQKRLNDPKVLRFLKLDASDRAAQEADPKEYESLKGYIRETYPDYYQHLNPKR